MASRFTGLWRNPDFLKLWTGQSVSLFGSLITRVALPLTAVLTLGATPLEMGLLRAAEMAPGLLVGLVAGAWVDRLRRRPIMILTDLGRAALIASVPLTAVLGALRIEQLYVVALLAGTLTVFFEIAYRSYLPTLVRREELVEGNSKLAATGSVAEVAGFGLAGALVQALTGPVTLLVDAVSFLVSAAALALIRRPEPAPAGSGAQPDLRREIGEGLRLIGGNPYLRTIAAIAGTQYLCMEVTGANYVLFITNELGVEPLVQGLLYAFGGVSSFLGSLVAAHLTQRFGLGRVLAGALVLGGLGSLLTPLATGPMAIVIAFLVAQQLLGDGALTVVFINQVSLRQAITPDALQGRMNATIRFIGWTAMVAGALLGGLLGSTLGSRPTLSLGALGIALAALWLAGSPLAALRTIPASPLPAPAPDATD